MKYKALGIMMMGLLLLIWAMPALLIAGVEAASLVLLAGLSFFSVGAAIGIAGMMRD